MEAIYERYRRRGTSFEMTLSLLQELLESRLDSRFRRIMVQGSNSGRSRMCFILFDRLGYTMRFVDAGSFRQFRHNGNLSEEIVLIERFIETLRTGILSDVIS
jgi:hypothetical protein